MNIGGKYIKKNFINTLGKYIYIRMVDVLRKIIAAMAV